MHCGGDDVERLHLVEQLASVCWRAHSDSYSKVKCHIVLLLGALSSVGTTRGAMWVSTAFLLTRRGERSGKMPVDGHNFTQIRGCVLHIVLLMHWRLLVEHNCWKSSPGTNEDWNQMLLRPLFHIRSLNARGERVTCWLKSAKEQRRWMLSRADNPLLQSPPL